MEKELLQYLQKMERYRQEHEVDLEWELEDRLLDFDPKQGGKYFTRFHDIDLRKFNLDEECECCISVPPLGPMRFTDAVYRDKGDYELCEAINIFSVKIGCSDVGFQSVCMDESLVLTGPKRGLALIDDVYIETDLKIKDNQGQDRELSKGVVSISGITGGSLDECNVGCVSLATRLSTVDVLYGFVANAVEGTISIEVIQGNFDGQITAHPTSTQNQG
ncbi:hypothetical protein PR202_ga15530 [Eleusine coracana subsp. coracana]|uniref:DUF6598 domain-containing protein n=1 Tax=Eleusine coracana subsp. coracana TaxID=191504 RepID=A0AAV5CKF6_ELECO|nr:hypothetical protein PR202_ga15530 [Eleusine coracana subsp. coracana]